MSVHRHRKPWASRFPARWKFIVPSTVIVAMLLSGPIAAGPQDASTQASTGSHTAEGTHPRVLFSAERTAAYIARRKTAEFRAYKSLMDAKVATPARHDDIATWHLAFLYPLTQDKRYCELAIKEADAMVRRDSSYDHLRREGYLRAADDFQNILLTFDWCHALVAPAQKAQWIEYANGGVDRIWKSNDTHWPFDDPHNNYWYAFLEATMLAGLATEGDNPRALEFQALFRTKVEKILLPAWTKPSWSGGGGQEGTHYDKWHRRLWRTLDWWKASTGEDFISRMTPTIPEQINFWLHQITPGRSFLFQWGDEAQDAQGPLNDSGRELFLSLMTLAPDSVEAQFAKDLLDHSPWSKFTRRADRPMDFILNTGAITPKSITGKPDVYLYTPINGAGKTFIRTGWGADASALSYAYRGRVGAAGSHDHIDKPGFQWWANGNFVVIDPNFYSRSGIAGGFLAGGSRLANMVRLEGAPHDAEAKLQPLVLHERDATASAVPHYYHSFDMRNIWKQASIFRRDYVFFPPSVLVTYDRVAAPQAKIWQVNVQAAPVIEGDLATVSAKGTTLRVFNLIPAGAAPSVRDWSAKPCCSTTFSGAYRLAWADPALDSTSVKVLDIGGSVRDPECTTSAADTRCTLQVDGRTIRIHFRSDAQGATIE